MGVAHDPVYTEEELTLTIPTYGEEDLVIKIPKDKYIRSIRYEPNWIIGTELKPAIVVTVSDGITDEQIAGDVSGIRGLFEGEDTQTATIFIDSVSGKVRADVRLSSITDNPLKVDNEGLYVDLSGVVGRKQIETGFLLVADGNGEFTYGGDGVGLEQTTAIADLTNPEKKVVTANLISDAITAAITALEIVIEGKIADIETRLGTIEGKLDFDTSGGNGTILVTNGDKLSASDYKIGGATLDTQSDGTVATEQAVTEVMSWLLL